MHTRLFVCLDGVGPDYLASASCPTLEELGRRGWRTVGLGAMPAVTNVNKDQKATAIAVDTTVTTHYRDHREQYVDRYVGQYILLQDNEVKWYSESGVSKQSRRELAGANKLSAMWLKLVDPEEAEDERYEVYERTLAGIRAARG